MWNSNDTTGVTRGIELAASYDLSSKIVLEVGYNKTDAAGDDGNIIGEATYKIADNVVAFGNVEMDVDASDQIARAGVSITF